MCFMLPATRDTDGTGGTPGGGGRGGGHDSHWVHHPSHAPSPLPVSCYPSHCHGTLAISFSGDFTRISNREMENIAV